MHLAEEIEEALLAHAGSLGRLLSLVVRAEATPSPALAADLESMLLSPADYLNTQIRASAWAIQVSRDL